jgi:RND superfamily putative drug exporter
VSERLPQERESTPAGIEAAKSGRPSRAFAWSIRVLRFLVVPALVVAAFGAWRYLPGVSSLPDSGVNALLPANTRAAQSETEASRLFGSSLLPRIAVVQRNPGGLTIAQQRRIVALAVRLDQNRLPGFPPGSRAVPYINFARVLPGAKERSTTAITFLGFPSTLSPQSQASYAADYARAVSVPGAEAEATGFIPGSVAQSDTIDKGLHWVELATVLLVAAIIGIYLRSLLAPLVTLAAAGISYLISIGLVSYIAETQGLRLQNQAEPIIVVLLLGVVTDYSVFFLSGMRGRLRAGEDARAAAQEATAEVVGIIITAGLVVAAGLATLRLASIGFVQTLGPAMAVVVLVSLAVAVTFVPAAMGILGRALFWPGLRRDRTTEPLLSRAGAVLRRGVARGTSWRWIAIPTVAVAVVGLVVAASGLAFTQLALTPIRGLTSDTPVARAAVEAERGFAGGVIAPTEIVLRGRDIGYRQRRLRRFGQALARQPAIGGVIGGGMSPLPRKYQLLFRTRSGDAVRYYVAFRHHPYSSAAISDLSRLQRAMPHLLADAGIARADVLYAGDTALAKGTRSLVNRDLIVIGLAAALVNLLLLTIFLRSLVAPVLLVASSALAIAATFGLTTYIFRDFFNTPDLTYFVPLAVGVLLLSFGTDYNLFIVGRIWQESKERDTAEAIRVAVPRASRAISIAGLALALSFAALAIVPIDPFREFAVAIAIGVIIDTFVVRTLLIPALLGAFGDKSWWPSSRSRRGKKGVIRKGRAGFVGRAEGAETEA